MVTSDIIKKTLLRELKKVQSVEQLNVSDALIEKIASQLTENLYEEIDFLNKNRDDCLEDEFIS